MKKPKSTTDNKSAQTISIRGIFLQFLKIGAIAFGGPAAHAGLMEHELVTRKKWITVQSLLDYIGAVNLIPGPNSTQLTMLVGYKLRGWRGMVAGGFGFIIPAAVITVILAVVYVRLGEVPAIESLFYGIKPAVIAVIAGAIYKMGKKAFKNIWLGMLGVIVLGANLLGLNEIMAILGAGIAGMTFYAIRRGFRSGSDDKSHGDSEGNDRSSLLSSLFRRLRGGKNTHALAPFVLLQATVVAVTQYSTLKLFWIFFKIGALLFGTGYVLVAYMDGELVEKAGWLTREQLLDAIAIGQFTPGPILSAATFTGYLLEGWTGAIVATMGIFLPSFAFILLLYPLIPRLRKSPYTANFLDSVNMGAVAVMLAVSIQMGFEVVADWGTALILGLGLLVAFSRRKPGAVWIILGGALLGLLLNMLF
ncbi:MAG: chromate efflux transporter [Bacteroidales bacterium]